MSSHGELINQVKVSQQQHLEASLESSIKLNKSIRALVASNSNGNSSNTLSILDKITTIHQLDEQIDKQLNEGISKSYGNLVRYETKLMEMIQKTEIKLNLPSNSVIDDLQKRAELVDQELRILEGACKLLKEQEL